MNFQAVDSSNIRAIAHDADKNLLAVEFLNGSVYHYEGVTEATYTAFANSGSKGQFLNQVIKPQYGATRIS